jgi:hypothetical protein
MFFAINMMLFYIFQNTVLHVSEFFPTSTFILFLRIIWSIISIRSTFLETSIDKSSATK